MDERFSHIRCWSSNVNNSRLHMPGYKTKVTIRHASPMGGLWASWWGGGRRECGRGNVLKRFLSACLKRLKRHTNFFRRHHGQMRRKNEMFYGGNVRDYKDIYHRVAPFVCFIARFWLNGHGINSRIKYSRNKRIHV